MSETLKTLTTADLRQFAGGTSNWYRHPLNHKVTYTDGVKYVAETGGAYWLLDEIALTQRYDESIAGEGFQVWRLTVNPDRTARLACEDGNDKPIIWRDLEFTDFPLDEITLWFTDNVILLPCEY